MIKLYAFTIDCPNPQELAKFYADLMKWKIVFSNDEYAVVGAPTAGQGTYPGITFQLNLDYKPPVWPTSPEEQQTMAHLDFAVDDLEKSVDFAIKCGAKLANEQFSDGWKVMIDPVGHPFCLVKMKSVIESESFSLL